MLAATLGLLVMFLSVGMYIAGALGILAILLDLIFAPGRGLFLFSGDIIWNASTNFVLLAAPLFILMGELLLRSGLADRVYYAVGAWFNGLPGGLMHTNIASCSLFAAISGSSVATAATIGTVALPSFQKAGYNERLVLGSLAAGGTLGILIPPSVPMIIYALITETSVGRLFAAGVVPGAILAGLFMLFIGVASVMNPRIAPKQQTLGHKAKVKGLVWIAPVGGLVIVVLGSIYGGLATPTEAAGLGIVGAVILSTIFRRMNVSMLKGSMESSARTTGMVMFIVAAAFFFNFVISSLGLPRQISEAAIGLPVPPLATLGIIVIFYVVLGMFMETLTIMVATLPVTFPVVEALFKQNPDMLIFDPVAFGVLFVILIEAALITPPVGLNLYVIQGIRRQGGPMSDVIVGAIPFFCAMLVVVGMLIVFPELALWLPNLVFNK